VSGGSVGGGTVLDLQEVWAAGIVGVGTEAEDLHRRLGVFRGRGQQLYLGDRAVGEPYVAGVHDLLHDGGA
jgi:hypothetical protein